MYSYALCLGPSAVSWSWSDSSALSPFLLTGVRQCVAVNVLSILDCAVCRQQRHPSRKSSPLRDRLSFVQAVHASSLSFSLCSPRKVPLPVNVSVQGCWLKILSYN